MLRVAGRFHGAAILGTLLVDSFRRLPSPRLFDPDCLTPSPCSATPPHDASLRSRTPDRDNEKRCRLAVEQAFGCAADQQPIDPGFAVGSNPSEISTPGCRLFRDLLVRDARAHDAVVRWEIGQLRFD